MPGMKACERSTFFPGVYVNLSEILRSLIKWDWSKQKMFWNITRQLIFPERALQVGWQLFGVRVPIFNFKF